MRICDLTAMFSPKLPIYGGGAGPVLTQTKEIARGDACNETQLDFNNHNGTHADMPKHFIDGGLTCDTMPLAPFFGPAKVFDLRRALAGRKLVEKSDLAALDIRPGNICLFNTGNSPLMRQSTFTADYVSFSLEAAGFLADKKVAAVGVDYLSFEVYGSPGFAVHKRLLGAGVAAVEGLVFDSGPLGFVPQGTYLFSALPLKIENGNGSPVRAALRDDGTVKLVIFDMDGLILDTEQVAIDSWMEAGRELGVTFPPELFGRLLGVNRVTCRWLMTEAMGPGFDYDRASKVRRVYENARHERHGITVKPGFRVLTDALKRLGIPACVATSTNQDRARQLLSLAGVADCFQTVVGGDTVQNGKPDPEIFLKAAAALGTDARDCVVLEDSLVGVEAAWRAGMRVIMVPDLAQPDAAALARVSAVCADLARAGEVIEWMV